MSQVVRIFKVYYFLSSVSLLNPFLYPFSQFSKSNSMLKPRNFSYISQIAQLTTQLNQPLSKLLCTFQHVPKGGWLLRSPGFYSRQPFPHPCLSGRYLHPSLPCCLWCGRRLTAAPELPLTPLYWGSESTYTFNTDFYCMCRNTNGIQPLF